MAKARQYYEDAKGAPHKKPEDAVASDIASVLGRVGDESGMALGVAKVLIEKRAEIEQAYADLDALKTEATESADAK